MEVAGAQTTDRPSFASRVVSLARLFREALGDLDSLDTVVDAATLVSVFGVLDRAELLATRTTAAYRAEVGGPDAATVLTYEAKLRRAQVDRRSSTAGLMIRVPAFGEAAAAGVLRAGHLMVLNRAVTPQRTEFAVRDAAVFVEAAEKLSMHEFGILIQRWEAWCDDELDVGLSGEEKAYRRRSLSILQGLDGSWKINGVLDALNGELVATALDAVMGKAAPEETRSVAQRRADALISMAIATMKDKQPSGTLAASQATIIVTAETGEAMTAGRVPVSASVRDAIFCDALVTVVKKTCIGIVFDVGTPDNPIPDRNRKAVHARDRCCRMPGCSANARYCDIHHIKNRQDGGTHELPNLVLLCRFHHRMVHSQQLSLRWEGATLIVEWPNGYTAHSPPASRGLAA
jgi:hypothetical protein